MGWGGRREAGGAQHPDRRGPSRELETGATTRLSHASPLPPSPPQVQRCKVCQEPCSETPRPLGTWTHALRVLGKPLVPLGGLQARGCIKGISAPWDKLPPGSLRGSRYPCVPKAESGLGTWLKGKEHVLNMGTGLDPGTTLPLIMLSGKSQLIQNLQLSLRSILATSAHCCAAPFLIPRPRVPSISACLLWNIFELGETWPRSGRSKGRLT